MNCDLFNMGVDVLSLFDGISCGRSALARAGMHVNKYYAAEVDTYAIKVSQANWPDNIPLGDVQNWREWDIDWTGIDYLIGGSPCQGFSFAGKQLAFDDPRSKLFFVYVDILNHIKTVNPNLKFLLENVRMKKEYLDVISQQLGVEPVFINSALVSAQNRQRFYWCNWDIEQPADRGILLGDIIKSGFVDRDKSHCLDANYFKGGNLKSYFCKNRRQLVFSESLISQKSRVEGPPDYDSTYYRKLTPVECERLMGLPDNYTNHVSNTQRYKMLGNGWEVNTITHILRGSL